MNKNILIISSHADDHLSCAGTMMKLVEEQGMVPFEVVLTDSSKGQDFRAKKPADQAVVKLMRAKELSQASQFLGIRETLMLHQLDFGLECQPKLVFALTHVIRKLKPQIVFIHSEFDAHPDHREAFRLSLDALKLAAMGVENKNLGPSFRVPVVLCFESMLPDRIQILVDITKFKDKKEQLFKIYLSQMSPKSLAFERGLMAVRGYHLKKADGFLAEGFTFQNEFPILGFENHEPDIF